MRTIVDAMKLRSLVKEECETNEKYGEYPSKRRVDRLMRLGILNLDKPPGLSSHELSSIVKRILGAEKAGHAGTLEALGRSWRIRRPPRVP